MHINKNHAQLNKLVKEPIRKGPIALPGYGPFGSRYIINKIKEEGLKGHAVNTVWTLKDIQNFLSISLSFREISKPRVILKAADLSGTKEKLLFAREHKLKLKIKLENYIDIDVMIAFMKNPEHTDLLVNLEVFELPLMNESSKKLWDLLASLSELNNLMHFSCADIVNGTLRLSELNNLAHFSCKCIHFSGILIFQTELPKLKRMHFEDVYHRYLLTLLESIKEKIKSQ